MIDTCAVCDAALVVDDGYRSCQVYIDGIEDNSDEHTSYPIS